MCSEGWSEDVLEKGTVDGTELQKQTGFKVNEIERNERYLQVL